MWADFISTTNYPQNRRRIDAKIARVLSSRCYLKRSQALCGNPPANL
jgi:hypothetical protein